MQSVSTRVTRCVLLAIIATALPLSATTFDFSTGSDFGFTNGSNTSGSWSFVSNSWQLTYGNSSDVSLLSPILTASGGPVTLQFTHSRNFESGWDGGIVELSLNGGAFSKITAFSQNGYDNGPSIDSGVSAILGDSMFSGTFATQTSIADLGTLASGDLLQLRWHSASDASDFPPAPNWVLNSVDLSSIVDPNATQGAPEPATFALAGMALAGGLLLRKYNARQE